MSIIISSEEGGAQKLDKSSFESEDYLQNYIHQNPEAIPVYEIQEDKRLFVVKRELETESGPIDALAIDKDGDIYIIETKLYKNPDKRTVVAQALDYGASLWKHTNDFGEFIGVLNGEIKKRFNLSFEEKIKEFFQIDEEQTALLLERMRLNLREGNIKFVILMDSMEERLKDLIVYVNQNSQFDIYAVQLEYYKFNSYEIMIPKIFGVEVRKNIGNSSANTRKNWTKEDFLQDLNSKTNPIKRELVKELLDFSFQNADKVTYGTGKDGIFRYVVKTSKGECTPFFVRSDGKIKLGLEWIKDQEKAPVELLENFLKKIDFIPSIKELGGVIDERLRNFSFEITELSLDKNSMNRFVNEVKDFTQQLRDN